jgi:hypothetical protein
VPRSSDRTPFPSSSAARMQARPARADTKRNRGAGGARSFSSTNQAASSA